MKKFILMIILSIFCVSVYAGGSYSSSRSFSSSSFKSSSTFKSTPSKSYSTSPSKSSTSSAILKANTNSWTKTSSKSSATSVSTAKPKYTNYWTTKKSNNMIKSYTHSYFIPHSYYGYNSPSYFSNSDMLMWYLIFNNSHQQNYVTNVLPTNALPAQEKKECDAEPPLTCATPTPVASSVGTSSSGDTFTPQTYSNGF